MPYYHFKKNLDATGTYWGQTVQRNREERALVQFQKQPETSYVPMMKKNSSMCVKKKRL